MKTNKALTIIKFGKHLIGHTLKPKNIIKFYHSIAYYRTPKLVTCCHIRLNDGISYLAKQSTQLAHPIGIIIAANAKIGKRVTIMQNVTIGQDKNGEAPKICDDVTIYAGAVIIGGITIGERAIIGANSVITKNVQPNSTVVGVNRIIKTN